MEGGRRKFLSAIGEREGTRRVGDAEGEVGPADTVTNCLPLHRQIAER
jgi:hypothetical protein